MLRWQGLQQHWLPVLLLKALVAHQLLPVVVMVALPQHARPALRHQPVQLSSQQAASQRAASRRGSHQEGSLALAPSLLALGQAVLLQRKRRQQRRVYPLKRLLPRKQPPPQRLQMPHNLNLTLRQQWQLLVRGSLQALPQPLALPRQRPVPRQVAQLANPQVASQLVVLLRAASLLPANLWGHPLRVVQQVSPVQQANLREESPRRLLVQALPPRPLLLLQLLLLLLV